MQDDKENKNEDRPEIKAGYLVMRLKPGEGVMVFNSIEVRVSSIKHLNEVQIAIRAPKEMLIRKLK